ncbi:DUF262 domain-containing protein [Colwellia sp. 75C3]|uniref:DUF262 domain-containing protein n=1 Tax=Colwellia sp. 75C3 TaxID=888425 RepID=UPI001E5DE3E1|nr:DUF262 domain-containing protein [Colwellia sp. 75C3]
MIYTGVNVEKANLQTLLAKNLTLPPYQRRYCWRNEQVNQLLTDIDGLLTIIAEDNTCDIAIPLFLGTVIVHHQNSDEDGAVHFDLVDGQQRSLTLCLLVMALVELNTSNNWFSDELLLNKKLSLLRATFTNRESQQQLAKNFALIKSHIKTKTWATSKQHLTYLFEKCEFVVITINSIDQAFAFFDSQNSAGKRLSEFDLLKARHLRGIISEPSVGIGCSRIWEEYENLKLNSCYSHRVAYYLTEQLIGRARQRQRGKHVDHLKLEDEFAVLTEKKMSSVQLAPQSNSLLYQNWQICYHPNQKQKFPFTFNTELTLDGANKLSYSLDDVKEVPLQLSQALVGGEQFFMFIAKYAELYKQLFSADIVQPSESEKVKESNDSIQGTLLAKHRLQEHQQGRGYPRLIQAWQALILFYVDRFGENDDFPEFVQLSDQYIFSLRIILTQVKRSSIERKLLDDGVFANLLQLPTSKQVLALICRLVEARALDPKLQKLTKEEIKGVRKKYIDSFYWQEDEENVYPSSLSTMLLALQNEPLENADA